MDTKTIIEATAEDQANTIVQEFTALASDLRIAKQNASVLRAELDAVHDALTKRTAELRELQAKRHQANNRKARRIARDMAHRT